jgi:hypothetical protein
MPAFGPMELIVIGVMVVVLFIIPATVMLLAIKYSRDRDRWKAVDEERLARSEHGGGGSDEAKR